MEDFSYMNDWEIRMTLIMRLLEVKPSNTRYDTIINIADEYFNYIKFGGEIADIVQFTVHEGKQ